MAIEMSNFWVVEAAGGLIGAIVAWIATEYKTRKAYRNIVNTLVKSANDLRDLGQIDEALSIYDDILEEIPRLDPAIRAEVKFNQGLSYFRSFEFEDEGNLDRSISAYIDALELNDPEKHPQERSQIQNWLGTAYLSRSQINGQEDDLIEAISAYDESMKFYATVSHSKERTNIQINLGDAYRLLSQIKDGKYNLKKAIKAYEIAHNLMDKEDRSFLDQAQIQNKLGMAYIDLSKVLDGSDVKTSLENAIDAYKEALKIVTLEKTPVKYAETQKNVGMAYFLLSEELSGSGEREAKLNEALRAYGESLKVKSLEKYPVEHAEIQNNLGMTYVSLSDVANADMNLNRAVSVYKVALKVRTATDRPLEYAETQNNLGIAYRKLSKIRNRDENLNKAILAYEEALRIRKEERISSKNVTQKDKIGDETSHEDVKIADTPKDLPMRNTNVDNVDLDTEICVNTNGNHELKYGSEGGSESVESEKRIRDEKITLPESNNFNYFFKRLPNERGDELTNEKVTLNGNTNSLKENRSHSRRSIR